MEADKEKQNSRRHFVKACVSATGMVIANPGLLASTHLPVKSYERVLLTDVHGDPLGSSSITANQCYVFHYPFVTTPCFLMNLDQVVDEQLIKTDSATEYNWQGGVGRNKSIVSFCAICAHKLSYPTKDASFISFRSEPVTFYNNLDNKQSKQQTIYCCSERSVYDPSQGAKVLGGPAPHPLTTVILEYDEVNDHLYATGTLGNEVFDRFFEKFEFRLALDHRITDVRKTTTKTSRVIAIQDFSNNDKLC